MKAMLDQLTVTQIEIEIPAACPECHVAFDEHGALTQFCWSAGNAECCINSQDDIIDFSGGTDYVDCEDYVTGYRCTACGHILASTEL